MTEPQYLSNDKKSLKTFIEKFDTFLFDCDGVIWSGDHLLDGVADTIELLKSLGKRLVFVTNNSTKSRVDYVKKFEKLGIQVATEEIFTSSYSAAVYLSKILKLPPNKQTIFLLSESGTEDELRKVGLKTIGGTDPEFRRDIDISAELPPLARGETLDPSVGAVLLALDFHVNYLKLAHATTYVRHGAQLLATNSDSSLPMGGGLFPGAGSIGISVINATGKQPVVLGKPSQAMMDAIEGAFDLDKAKTCMVGDRLDTDIKFGVDGGLGGTLLVLTGVTQKDSILKDGKYQGEIKPSIILDKLSDLLIAKDTGIE